MKIEWSALLHKTPAISSGLLWDVCRAAGQPSQWIRIVDGITFALHCVFVLTGCRCVSVYAVARLSGLRSPAPTDVVSNSKQQRSRDDDVQSVSFLTGDGRALLPRRQCRTDETVRSLRFSFSAAMVTHSGFSCFTRYIINVRAMLARSWES